MSRYLGHALIALNLLLAGLLLTLWFDRQGNLRNSHWTPPVPIKPDLSGGLGPIAREGGDDVGRFVAMLDRPLFSPSRRPPPPPAVVIAPPPDPLANIQVVGVYAGANAGGIIARVDGKMRRVSINEKIGDWTIQGISGRDVTFARGAERRVIRLAPGRAAPAGTPIAPKASSSWTPAAAALAIGESKQLKAESYEPLAA